MRSIDTVYFGTYFNEKRLKQEGYELTGELINMSTEASFFSRSYLEDIINEFCDVDEFDGCVIWKGRISRLTNKEICRIYPIKKISQQ